MKYFLDDNNVIVDEEDGQHIAELCDGASRQQGESTIKAMTHHDDLVAALKMLLADHIAMSKDLHGLKRTCNMWKQLPVQETTQELLKKVANE
jgi:hypothetical protein